MNIDLVRDLVVIFGMAIAVVFACHRLKVPTIVGFLVTGIVAGPHGLGFVDATAEVEQLADLGVILLLFTIGIEFSLDKLWRMKTLVLAGGALQVAVTLGIGFGVAKTLGASANTAIAFGMIAAMSSTAIVLKVLQDRAEMDSPHGQATLGVLIFQDIAVVPMILILPLLAGAEGSLGQELLVLAGKGLGLVALTLVLARYVVPFLFYKVARLRDREVFMFTVVFIGFGIAWLTYFVGLKPALGAFLAGLVISESEYAGEALGNVLPFRNVFTSLFFISVGMLLNPAVFLAAPALILAVALAALAVKTFTGTFAVAALGQPLRTALLAGLNLCQVGEFSFLLASTAAAGNLLSGGQYQSTITVIVISMMAAPFIIKYGDPISAALLKLPFPERLRSGLAPGPGAESDRGVGDHLIIVGFGPGGRNLAQAARTSNIPYVAIELNAETVKREKSNGHPIYFGDATQPAVLEHAHIHEARVLVVAIPDPAATRRIVEVARSMSEKVHIVARTPYIREVDELRDIGADDVVPAEFETSIEIFTRVLNKYLVPKDEIDRFVNDVRADAYQVLRSEAPDPEKFCDLPSYMPGVDVFSVEVQAGSAADGKTLAELDLRNSLGLSVIAVRKGDRVTANPKAGQLVEAGDVALLLGSPEKSAALAELFHAVQKAGLDENCPASSD